MFVESGRILMNDPEGVEQDGLLVISTSSMTGVVLYEWFAGHFDRLSDRIDRNGCSVDFPCALCVPSGKKLDLVRVA